MTLVPICDFCATSRPIWRYPCRTVRQQPQGIPGIPDLDMVGAWAACSECGTLIEQERVDQLARTAAAKLRRRRIPCTPTEVRKQQQLYWRNRIVTQERRPYIMLPEEAL